MPSTPLILFSCTQRPGRTKIDTTLADETMQDKKIEINQDDEGVVHPTCTTVNDTHLFVQHGSLFSTSFLLIRNAQKHVLMLIHPARRNNGE